MNIYLVGAGYWGSKVKAELEKIDDVTTTIIDIKNGQTIDDITTVDPVILATPLWQHHDQAKKLLIRGHDVYVEKPMAETALEVEELIEVRGDQVLMAGHIFLYNPLLLMLKSIVDKGDLGDIKHIKTERLNWGIRQTKTTPALSLAPHDVSIIQYLFGEDMTVSSVQNLNLSNNIQPDSLQFEGLAGSVTYDVHVSWYWPTRKREVTVIGDKALAVWNEDTKTITITHGRVEDNGYITQDPTVSTIAYPTDASPLFLQLQHFVHCVKTRQAPISSAENALAVARVIDQL